MEYALGAHGEEVVINSDDFGPYSDLVPSTGSSDISESGDGSVEDLHSALDWMPSESDVFWTSMQDSSSVSSAEQDPSGFENSSDSRSASWQVQMTSFNTNLGVSDSPPEVTDVPRICDLDSSARVPRAEVTPAPRLRSPEAGGVNEARPAAKRARSPDAQQTLALHRLSTDPLADEHLSGSLPLSHRAAGIPIASLDMEQIMTLFRQNEQRQSLPPRPMTLPSTVLDDQTVFAESTGVQRRKMSGARGNEPPDEWRNTGGKNAVVCFDVPSELTDGWRPRGLVLARRCGKITRDGMLLFRYHQFNIDNSARPSSRSGKVTLYHILPADTPRQAGVGLKMRGAPKGQALKSNEEVQPPAKDLRKSGPHAADSHCRRHGAAGRSDLSRAWTIPKSERRAGDASFTVSRPGAGGEALSRQVLEQDEPCRVVLDFESRASIFPWAAVAKKRRTSSEAFRQIVVWSASALVIAACVAFSVLTVSDRGGDAGTPVTSNANVAPDGCFGSLLPDAKPWPARCRDHEVEETCSSNQLRTPREHPGCSLWCDAGFEPVGSLCCGPDGLFGNRGAAGCKQCRNGYWSDGARPCQACTVCEQRGSFTVKNCSTTEDATCHSYWVNMVNSHEVKNQSVGSAPSTWHLPSDFVAWSDGAALFAFGGSTSSLPEDTSTSTMCLPPGSSAGERSFRAGMSAGEPQITNELWRLQLTRASKKAGIVTIEFEAETVRKSIVFEPMCDQDRAQNAETKKSCNDAGKGCVWTAMTYGRSDPLYGTQEPESKGTCTYGARATAAVVKKIDADAGYPSHKASVDETAAGQLLLGGSRRVSVGWLLQAVNGVPTANLTFHEQMAMVSAATSRAERGAKLTLSFSDDTLIVSPESKGVWELIGGGPSRAVDEYFNGKLQYGYFGSNYGGSPGYNASSGQVTEEDFDGGFVGNMQAGASGPNVWPRARFGASAWGDDPPSRRMSSAGSKGTFTGMMFSGMVSRPCFSSETVAMQQNSGLGQDVFLMPNDLWGFSADSKQFTFLGGTQHWIWRQSLVDLAKDLSNGFGRYPIGRWGAQTYKLENEFFMFSGQTMIVNMAIGREYTDAERSQRFLLNDLWKLQSTTTPENSPDRWSWVQQKKCLQGPNGLQAQSKLKFPGPRTGAAIWTAPCCVVGAGPRLNHVNHKMCNAAKYKNLKGQCAHIVSDTVFMFGGVGLMESPSRNTETCVADQPGRYVLDVRQQTKSWSQTNSTRSWLQALDWELFDSLCDLWQGDSTNRWSLVGACGRGLQSPVNPGVATSLTVEPTNTIPFPDGLTLAGVYKASTWTDSVGNLWLFGGYMGNPVGNIPGLYKTIAHEYHGGTICNRELWAYDPVQGGSWSHIRPPTDQPSALVAGAGALSALNWPQLGKCGAIAWQPWYRVEHHVSGDPQTVRATHVNILGGTQWPNTIVATFDGHDCLGEAPQCTSYERAALYQMPNSDLKDMLRARGEETKGDHDTLVQRLLDDGPMQIGDGNGGELPSRNARWLQQLTSSTPPAPEWDSSTCVARPLQFFFDQAF